MYEAKKRIQRFSAAIGMYCAWGAATVGCASTGTAVGELQEPANPDVTAGAAPKEEAVSLTWKSDATDQTQGTLAGTLPDGTHYAGKYHEVVTQGDARVYEDLWEGWDPYWPGWAVPWGQADVEPSEWGGFVTIYTGHVVANLRSDDGTKRMRCRFTIDDPAAGLRGGGHGDCQLPNKESIDNVVLAPL